MKSVLFLLLLVLAAGQRGHGSNNQTEDDQTGAAATKETLYLLSLLPFPGTPGVHPILGSEGPALILAAQLAVDTINNSTDILPGYNLEIINASSGCSVDTVYISKESLINELFYVENRPLANVVGIVGPTCSDAALAVSYLIARPEISLLEVTIASSKRLSERTLYKNTFSTSGSSDIFVNTLLSLMRTNKWNSVATIYDASLDVFSRLYNDFLLKVRSVPGIDIDTTAVFDESSIIDFDLLNLRKIRVIFLITGPNFGRKILCLAAQYRKLTLAFPKYQFVLLTDSVNNFISSNMSFVHGGEQVFCTIEQMKRTVEGSILLRHQFVPVDKTLRSDAGLSYNEFSEKYGVLADRENLARRSNAPSIYFDAVWSLALALNNSLGVNLSDYNLGQPSDTMYVRQELERQSFIGVSGKINFNRNTGFTDRNVDIFQVKKGSMVLLEYYDSERDQIRQIDNNTVEYISGTFDEYSYASLALGIVLMLIIVIAVGVLVCVQVLSVVFASYPSIKASSPKITHTAYLGCYIIALGTMVLIFGESFRVSNEDKCRYLHAYNCFFVLGGVFLFATLVIRTFRIYRIFVHYLDPGRLVGDAYLIAFVIGAVCVIIPFLIGWTIHKRPDPLPIPLLESGTGVVVWIQCVYSTDYRVWQALMFVYSWVFALAACVFAILSLGKVRLKNFQISSVIFLCFSLMLEIPLLIIFLFSLGTTPANQEVPRSDINLYFAARCIIPILALYLCLLLFFLPPIYPLLREKYSNQFKKPEPVLRTPTDFSPSPSPIGDFFDHK